MKLSEGKVFVDPEAILAKIRPLWESEFLKASHRIRSGSHFSITGSIRTLFISSDGN